MKKYLSLVFAALLVQSMLTGCAGQGGSQAAGISDRPVSTQTSLPAENGIPDNSFTSEEYEKLLTLRFDGYEEITIAEFREKVGVLTDTIEYRSLFERLSKSKAFYELKDTEEDAAFLFYILMPLMDDKWQTQEFSGAAALIHSEVKAVLEYVLVFTIENEKALTVHEYSDARTEIMDSLQTFLNSRTAEELQDSAVMQTAICDEIQSLTQLWENENLKIEVEYTFRSEEILQNEVSDDNGMENADVENRQADYGTTEDYCSLFELKTANYKNMSIEDFNAKLLAWANEDFDRMERIDADTKWNDFQVELNAEELSFVQLTVFLSGNENGEFVRSSYMSEPETDPVYHQNLPQKLKRDKQRPIWCDLYYPFSYHITDKETLTVGERDRCVNGMISAVRRFWDETTLEDLLAMTESDIISRLASLAAEYSNRDITITINEEQVHFEHAEEIDGC